MTQPEVYTVHPYHMYDAIRQGPAASADTLPNYTMKAAQLGHCIPGDVLRTQYYGLGHP